MLIEMEVLNNLKLFFYLVSISKVDPDSANQSTNSNGCLYSFIINLCCCTCDFSFYLLLLKLYTSLLMLSFKYENRTINWYLDCYGKHFHASYVFVIILQFSFSFCGTTVHISWRFFMHKFTSAAIQQLTYELKTT